MSQGSSDATQVNPVHQALDAWQNATANSVNDTNGHFAKHWRRPECTLLRHVREQHGDLTQLSHAVINFSFAEHKAIAARAYPTDANAAEQLARQVSGILAGAKAAHALRAWRHGAALPSDFIKRATDCLAAFEQAWPIWKDQHLTSNSAVNRSLNNPPRSTEALWQLLRTASDRDTKVSVSAVLTVRRLLAYLLGDEPYEDPEPAPAERRRPNAPFVVETKVLYASKLRDGDYEGYIGGLKVRAAPEGHGGCYLDPIAVGLVQVDASMLDCLTLTWRRVAAALGAETSLRIAPEVPRATKLLSGGSAGAIFVCAMFAASRREELNSDATTSIALVNPGTADSVDGLNSIQIKPVAADSMQAKLDEAQRRGLKRVVLHPEQTGYKAPLGLQVGNKVSDLADVYDQLTGNARMERVLARYSDAVAEAWHQLWTTENDERLLYYVPPKYRLLRPNASKKGLELMVALTEHATRSETTPEEPYEDIALDSEEQTLTALLKKAGPKLCISEGPGAGKSIFTRRLAAFLSGQAGRDALANGKPFLAVRWEEWGLDARWPQDFEQSLADAVRSARDAEGIAESAEEVVAWALEHGRVVFILDALDQTADDRVECFRDFLAQLHTRKCICRIVLTGRPFAVETLRAPLLAHGGWRFGAILPFDFQQQYRYLLGPESVPGATDAWQARDLAGVSIRRLVNPVEGKDQDELIDSLRNLFPFYGDVQELLGNPNTLWMVRRLAEEGHALNFRNRTELYLQTSRFMLDYAARKLREWPTEKGQAAAWGEHEITRGDRERWEELLAAAAFEMMSRHAEHFRVSGQLDVDLLRRGAGQRCSTPPDDAEWRLVERIAQLTNRTLLYASSQLVWAWPNRRMMEFYCGLHLARNSQSGWVQDEVGQPLRCGDETLRQHAGDPQWKEPFLYALEMPASVRNDAVLRASLAELFQPDAGLHTDNRRPTELMFHAYGALTSVPRHLRELQLPDRVIVGGERVLQEYHRQFRLLVEQRNPIALELVLDHEITAEEGQQNRWPSFVACPPGERPPETECTFNMGAREFEARDSDDVRPVHPVRLTPFWLQTTSVTRQQFGLFDPHYEKAEQVTLTKYAPKLTCPAIEVSYYDAYLFALFIGGRLPTEAEWEYACRARTDTPYSFGYQLNGDKANVDGNHPYGTEDIGRYLEQTSEVGSYACNDFGLYDMHGNVWEWCADWHDDDYYQSCIDKNGTAATPDPQGPEEGVFRSLRGGSWYNNARRARSAYRSGEEPDLRCSDFGFRVMLLRTVFAA